MFFKKLCLDVAIHLYLACQHHCGVQTYLLHKAGTFIEWVFKMKRF